MKKTGFFLAVILSVLLAACQKNNNQQPGTANDTTMNKDTSKISQDTDFLNSAAEDGMMEVQLGKMAQQKATFKDIKDFGKMMETDHSNANDELKSLAQKNNITLPDTLSNDKQDKIKDLAKLSGKKFDKQYVDMMVDGHQDAVSKFKDESQNASSPEVRQWAAKTLPTLQKHLDKIKEIQKKHNY
jgi:putative membrane protein